MCGIAGVVWNDRDRRTTPGLIQRMTDAIAHRGPDGEGHEERPGMSFGHRRLAIIDLAGGRQPMCNEDGSVWVTFNGEIYNFQELHADLVAKGHTFRTKSDTETLVHLYEELGERMLAKLRGMFAFAIWDEKRRKLLVARDFYGKKPLVYWQNADGFRFASELKSLLCEQGFPKDVDHEAIDDYLMYQYIPHPKTIFKAARKLPPGSFGVFEDGKLRIEEYWRPPYEHEEPITEEDAVAQIRETLTEAVRLRMISDVPLGAFLSGGIDSTIIVGLMQKLSNAPVKTFSIGFPVKSYDESGFARAAAKHLGVQHHEMMVEPDAVNVIQKLAHYYDEPFADSSAVPTYYVSQMTRQHVTVSLSGDGGDELFCGYPRYTAVRLGERFDKLPRPLKAMASSSLWQKLPAPARQKSKRRRLQKLLRVIKDHPTNRYRHWISIFDDSLRPTLYTDAFAESLHGRRASAWLESLFDELPMRDSVTRTNYVDQRSYLPCDILAKVDFASMAHGLECRCPFLDKEVAALAGKLPISLKLRGRTMKYLLKKAFEEFFPPGLLHRSKMGFGVPIDHWMRKELAPLVGDLLLSKRFADRGWLRPDVVARLFNEHKTSQWDHSARLWALVMLELWARNYLDG
jgi:asparagine synthase (glutamine-hydrolysing)